MLSGKPGEHFLMGRLRTLELVTIDNPIETMDAMEELVGLPKRAYVPVIRDYAMRNGFVPKTALQLYLELSEVLSIYSNKQKNYANQSVVQKNLLKLLGADWSRHDLFDGDVRDWYK